MHQTHGQGHLPHFLSVIHPKFKNPRNAIIITMLVGCIFLFMYRGWYQLVAVISVLHLFSYLPAPIVVISNRIKNKASLSRTTQFIMPCAHFLAPLLLFTLSLLLFYAGWPLIPELLILVIPGICLYLYYETKFKGERNVFAAIKGVSWLILYFVGLCLIVFFGDNHSPGNVISTETSMICLIVLSLVVYFYGAFYAWDKRTFISRHETSAE